MRLDQLIKSAVAQSKTLTSSLLTPVTHHTPSSKDQYGPKFTGTGTVRKALIEDEQKIVRAADGTEQVSVAKLTFLESVTVTVDDKFTLPSGFTGRVLKHAALLDPAGKPYTVEVWLGA